MQFVHVVLLLRVGPTYMLSLQLQPPPLPPSPPPSNQLKFVASAYSPASCPRRSSDELIQRYTEREIDTGDNDIQGKERGSLGATKNIYLFF